MTTIKLSPQPANLDIALYPHQRANIFQMERLEREKFTILSSGDRLEGNIGILGDPPGTGKTYTVLGLICRDKMDWKEPLVDISSQVCSNIDGSLRITRTETMVRIPTTLIITPLSIFHQWESEIKHTNLTYKMVKARADITDVEKYDVVVCTVNMFNDLALKYNEFYFKRFIYDEMDSAYIPNMETIKAGFSWFVSATFDQVLTEINRSRRSHHMKRLFMNILSDYYSRSSLLKSITVNSNEKLRAMQPVPFEYRNVYYDVIRAPVVNHLRGQMDDDLIQMIDAGNIRDAVRHLGGLEDDSNIADLLRRRAADKVREAEEKVANYTGNQRDEWATRLTDARRTLNTIEERIRDIEMDTCGLCNEAMKYPTLLGCCQNMACGRCVTTWIRTHNTCPYCRNKDPHLVHLTHYIPEDEKEEEKFGNAGIQRGGDKFTHLQTIARTGKKVLVFAAHSSLFAEISTALRSQGTSYSLVTGSVSQRQAALDAYIRGDTKVLILNSRMNGAGLNLQITTDIILWHAMPAPLTKQMIGRALRYGMNHPLIVHKFFSAEEDGHVANAQHAPVVPFDDGDVECRGPPTGPTDKK
jgi:hypothetical protein